MKALYLVSACLAGANTRFDGTARPDPEIVRLVREGRAIPICPEQLGGLPTPRPPSEITGGDGHDVIAATARVLTCEGRDVTEAFLRGAQETLRLAREWQIAGAILKARSPSCGYLQIHDGSFEGGLRAGSGVTAALLKEAGLQVFCEETWKDKQALTDQPRGESRP
ncbi:MAG: DUF523 domain-containing protein [Firmicutes bacterium]|nr:DUF523 domain-containing protein [Bacillota bacterium]